MKTKRTFERQPLTQTDFFKKTVKVAVIVYRDNSSYIIQTVRQTEKWLKEHNINIKTFSQSSLAKRPPLDFDIDLAIVLGGDGTYLQAVQSVSNHSVPFLGINMGSFGFLTVHRQESIISCLKSILKGEMKEEERALLKVSVKGETDREDTFLALNDMVIERGAFSHLINISVAIQNQNIYSVKSDGLIVSSPTGSTAYNLAAGGPILHPQVNAFSITPICSHSLTNRPVIVPNTCEMSFTVNSKNQSVFLTIDGKKRAQISNKHLVKMKKALKKHRTLRKTSHNDFLLLKDKLKFSQ